MTTPPEVGDWVPRPDPTVLTTEQLHREIEAAKTLLEAKLDAEIGLTAERFRSQQAAVHIAQVATEARFASVNEFRAQLSDVTGTMITRAESEARFNALDARILDIKSTIDKGFTSVETSTRVGDRYWGYIIGAIGLIALVATSIINLVHVAGH